MEPTAEGGFQPRRPKNLASRIFHCLIAVAFFILLLLALSSLGNSATIYNEVREDSVYGKKGTYGGDHGTCILYADFPCSINDQDDNVCLSSDPPCQFAITGSGVMALAALLLMVLSLVKAALGISAFCVWVVIDLVLVIVSFLIGIASSGVISGGLAATCEAYRQHGKVDDDVPCCTFSVEKRSNSSDRIYFYEPLDAAQIAGWAATIMLFVAMVLDIVLIVVYAVRRSMRNTLAGYTHPESVSVQPPPYQDEDELPDVDNN